MATDKSGWVVGKALAAQAAARGSSPFMQFQDGEPVTYGEADAIANRVANGLAKLNVGRGDPVGVMLPNGLEYCHAWFGISRLGAVHVAINTAYKGIFLEHVLNNSAARVLMIAPEYLPLLREIEANVPRLELVLVPGLDAAAGGPSALQRIRLRPFEELLEAPAEPPRVEISYMDTGAIMYTSGTTGPSKGVLMPHAHLYLFALGTVDNFRITAEDVYYICMPLFHANAMLMQLYGTLLAGAKAAIAPAFSASRWLDDVRGSGATITNTLGVMTDFVWRQPPRPEDSDHKLRMVCAVPSAAEIADGFRERFGVRLIELYGMTEVNIPLYIPLDGPFKAGSCGKVYDRFFELKVVHPDTDEELPPDEVGEILVRPKEPYGFMQGYNAMDDKTVETWRNFWFHTGDAARRDADGYFFFVDRIKDRIRYRGENLSSYEIEHVLCEHPAVAEAAAIAVKGGFAGGEDEVKACIVLKPGASMSPEELLEHCQGRMPYFAVPRYVEFLPALPKTPTEKVQKAKLREAGVTPDTWDREAAGYEVKRG
jgi:crotonobetaine/carnitine-CoA ligase